ncbi:YbjN domain-containing protein [uncultured Tateyamaria sp.]|uniref:YbjN domain-containing protein n=2 Tax=uncultured Tateyamaria sp. TaxID=455651 RepID=UPI00262FBF52|nr:YbjN domain-containing protein [uncultured Tateyamaria sp.]
MSAALVLAVMANTALADTSPIVRLDNPAAVAVALRQEGFRSQLTKDDRNRPVIETGIGGIYFSVKFYGCSDGRDCFGLLLTAWFDVENGVALDVLNRWNSDAYIGRAYSNAQCDPVIDHYIFVDRKREVSHFIEEIEFWGEALADFRDAVFEADETPNRVATCGGDDVL